MENLSLINQKVTTLVKSSSKVARQLLSYKEATSLNVLPLAIYNEKLIVAVSDVFDPDVLKFKTGLEIKPTKVESEYLESAIFKAYHSDVNRIEEVLPKFKVSSNKIANLSDLNNFKGEINTLIQRLLEYALATNCSDLHFIPNSKGYSLNIRNSGSILESTNEIFNHDYAKKFIARIKTLANLNYLLTNIPQDGALRFNHLGSPVNFRISVFPATYGERCVVRVLGNEQNYEIDNLNYNNEILDFLKLVLQKKFRLILIAGATGSGKTTLGYSILNLLKNSGKMIVTVEDPVESYLANISQSSLDLNNGFSHEIALKSVLRQDPDILYYGEIRDSLSAKTCIQAALTGHTVITTIHSGSLEETIDRLVNLGVPAQDFLNNENIFIYQKLIPKLCECKKIDLNYSEFFEFNIYKRFGCENCQGTGYSGSLPIIEIATIRKNYISGNPKDFIKEFKFNNDQQNQLLSYLKEGIISP